MVGHLPADPPRAYGADDDDPFMVEWHVPMDGKSNYVEPCHHPTTLVVWPARRCTTAPTRIVRCSILVGAPAESTGGDLAPSLSRCQSRRPDDGARPP